MNDDKPSAKDEFAMLGRGILRTFVRDVLAVGTGALIGVVICLILGFSVWLGASAGAFLALLLRSVFNPLFDYDRPPADRDTDL